MGAWIGPVVGGAIGALGSMANASQTNSANASLNQANMDWQTMMSNTAVQRRSADLRAAGINPILAAGQSASQPGFSPIGMQQANIAGGISAGSGVASAAASMANINADTEQKKASAALTRNMTPDNMMPVDEQGNPDFTKMQSSLGNISAARGAQEIKNAQATWGSIKALTQRDSTQADINAAEANIKNLSYGTAQKLQPLIIKQAANDLGISTAELSEANASAKIMGNPTWGPILKAVHAVLGSTPLGTAAGVLRGFK